METFSVLPFPANPASPAPEVLLVLKDSPAKRDLVDPKERMEKTERTVNVERTACKDLQVNFYSIGIHRGVLKNCVF